MEWYTKEPPLTANLGVNPEERVCMEQQFM